MARTRTEIRALGDIWNPTTLWYAKAVGALLQRPATQKQSWRYLAAMHNFNQQLWVGLNYLTPGQALPPANEQGKYWRQCQHQSWYFLPWHRAYLHTFEDIIIDTIRSLGGPADSWALPYWNYSNTNDPNAVNVPDAFMASTLPDGSNNPLNVAARFGTAVDPDDVELTDRIADNDFIGTDPDQGPSIGVGGPRTRFSLSGQQEGLIEAKPHDLVHGDVGGRGGLMSDPRTAALDPIFWLHHANIDRLWEVWLARDTAHNKNPTESAWVSGPTVTRSFALFGPDGNDRPSNPSDVLSTTALGYVYDDISDPLGGATRLSMRLAALRPRLQSAQSDAVTEDRPVDRQPPKTELLGSNDTEITLGANAVRSRIKLATGPLSTLSHSFNRRTMAENTPGEPDRVFLQMQNIRGTDDAGVFDVYLHGPKDAPGAPGVKAGSIGLFGLSQASTPDGDHAGNGLNKTIEITKAVDAMKLDPAQTENLDVEIVPRSGVGPGSDIKVGQITVHRMSGQ
jgi:tyrosinase